VSASRRRLGAAVRPILDELNHLLNRTLTQRSLVATESPTSPEGRQRVQFGFRVGGRVVAARLETRYGSVGLSVGRIYETAAGRDLRSPRLIRYRYALHAADDAEPVIRWEYDGRPVDHSARWCRHHIQGTVPVPLGGRSVPLNQLHTPTGEVLIEEVIRFCIVDLGVEPLSGDWDEILIESRGRNEGRADG
jgi:hypothetical protein